MLLGDGDDMAVAVDAEAPRAAAMLLDPNMIISRIQRRLPNNISLQSVFSSFDDTSCNAVAVTSPWYDGELAINAV